MSKNTIISICLRAAKLEWTAARSKKDGLELLEQRSAPVDSNLEGSAFSEALKNAYTGPLGQIWTVLPADQVLLRVVELPTSDADELSGMVELQVDKFSPFSADEMVVSFELLSQEEGASRVLIVAVRREILESLGELYGAADLLPIGVDVELLCWWKLLDEQGKLGKDGRRAIVVIDGNQVGLIVLQAGLPISFRSLGQHRGLDDQAEVTEVVEDVLYSLTSLETEWGGADLSELAVWSTEKPPISLLDSLRDACGLEVTQHELSELPDLSEGVTHRAIQPQAHNVNLALSEWAAREQFRHLRKVFLIATGIFLVVWLTAVMAFVVVGNYQKQAFARLQAEADGYLDQANQLEQLEKKVLSLEQYADRTHSALECMREITTAMPKGVEMNSLSYKKGKSVNIRGLADTVDPVYDFIDTLQKSELFDEVKSSGISAKKIRRKSKTE